MKNPACRCRRGLSVGVGVLVLEVLDRILEVLEEEVVEAGVTRKDSVDLAPRDDLAGVAVEAVELLVAVLHGKQVVRQAILAVVERHLEEGHAFVETNT